MRSSHITQHDFNRGKGIQKYPIEMPLCCDAASEMLHLLDITNPLWVEHLFRKGH